MRLKERRDAKEKREGEEEGNGHEVQRNRAMRACERRCCARFQRIADIREAEQKLQQRVARHPASDVSTLGKVL